MHSEINPSLLLIQLSSDQSTGCLEVVYNSITWKIFLRFGQLLSVDCSISSWSQLIQRLRQIGCEEAAKAVENNIHNTNVYFSTGCLVRQEIDTLAEKGLLDRAQLRYCSLELTRENLESLIWLTHGTSTWHPNQQMPTTTITNSQNSLNTSVLLDYYRQRLTIWQTFNVIVQSPHQRPYLTNENLLENTVPKGTLSLKALQQISQLMRGASLREIAILIKQDELKLVQLLIPYIYHNVFFLRKPSAPFDELPTIPKTTIQLASLNGQQTPVNQQLDQPISQNKIYQIACIDDSPMILDEIERFLGKSGKYQLTKLDEPVKASAAILRLKPDLILMDITMPNINGYKLCSLFRSSEALANTPIIMVTGNKGLVDQVRAKLVGATDYLTKPFTEKKLLEIVEKYLS